MKKIREANGFLTSDDKFFWQEKDAVLHEEILCEEKIHNELIEFARSEVGKVYLYNEMVCSVATALVDETRMIEKTIKEIKKMRSQYEERYRTRNSSKG